MNIEDTAKFNQIQTGSFNEIQKMENSRGAFSDIYLGMTLNGEVQVIKVFKSRRFETS